MNLSMTSTVSATTPIQKHHKASTISCRASILKVNKEKNFYEVLSLDSENVGVDKVKKAYRNMALHYHPDVCPPSKKEEFTKMFVEVHEAYKTLSDPNSRRKYDYELSLNTKEGSYIYDVKLEFPREAWEDQLLKLKRRSEIRMKQREEGCWSGWMRAQPA